MIGTILFGSKRIMKKSQKMTKYTSWTMIELTRMLLVNEYKASEVIYRKTDRDGFIHMAVLDRNNPEKHDAFKVKFNIEVKKYKEPLGWLKNNE